MLESHAGASAHIIAMGKTKLSAAVLLCFGCSGGAKDANGAYTVCGLCELAGIEAEAA